MAKKISEFFCVATSGPTVDGRELREQWLQDSAKTYARTEYQAMIWYEHYRWWGNLGQVIELKIEKQDDGRYKVFNRLQPSDELIEINRAGQKLFSSMEIVPNFAQSGMAYQIGLGVTDTPASLGTEQLKFNTTIANKINADPEFDQEFKQFCNGVLCERIDKFKQRIPDTSAYKGKDVEIFIGEEWPDLEFSTPKTVFDLGAKLLGLKQKTKDEEQDIDMTPKEFATELNKQLKPFEDQLTKLSKRIDSIKPEEQEEQKFASKKDVSKINEKIDKLVETLSKTGSGDGDREENNGSDSKFGVTC